MTPDNYWPLDVTWNFLARLRVGEPHPGAPVAFYLQLHALASLHAAVAPSAPLHIAVQLALFCDEEKKKKLKNFKKQKNNCHKKVNKLKFWYINYCINRTNLFCKLQWECHLQSCRCTRRYRTRHPGFLRGTSFALSKVFIAFSTLAFF